MRVLLTLSGWSPRRAPWPWRPPGEWRSAPGRGGWRPCVGKTCTSSPPRERWGACGTSPSGGPAINIKCIIVIRSIIARVFHPLALAWLVTVSFFVIVFRVFPMRPQCPTHTDWISFPIYLLEGVSWLQAKHLHLQRAANATDSIFPRSDLFRRGRYPTGDPAPRHLRCLLRPLLLLPPDTEGVWGVCLSQRQALPLPRREQLHLPGCQQHLPLELTCYWHRRNTSRPWLEDLSPCRGSASSSDQTPGTDRHLPVKSDSRPDVCPWRRPERSSDCRLSQNAVSSTTEGLGVLSAAPSPTVRNFPALQIPEMNTLCIS